MQHILKFNKKVQELMNSHSNNSNLKLVKEFQTRRRLWDYYGTLDSFGFEIKFVFLVIRLTNGKYIPCVRYYSENKFEEEPRTIELVDEHSAFESIPKCYEYLAKEYVYRLMSLPNLKLAVNSRN